MRPGDQIGGQAPADAGELGQGLRHHGIEQDWVRERQRNNVSVVLGDEIFVPVEPGQVFACNCFLDFISLTRRPTITCHHHRGRGQAS